MAARNGNGSKGGGGGSGRRPAGRKASRSSGGGDANGGGAGGAGGAASGGRVRFDAIDLAILNQLQTDAKITNATLSQRVGISPPSTLERVKKLENAGIIRGYVALIDPASVNKGISAIVHVTLREHGEARLETFKEAIAKFSEVQLAWHTAGEEDFILKVLVTDMEEYESFVVHRLSAVPNIGRVRTSFCLSAAKDETRVPLDGVGGGG